MKPRICISRRSTARGTLSTKRPGPGEANDGSKRPCAMCGTKRSAVHFIPAEKARDGGHLSRPCAREMLEPVEQDFSSQPMPFDVEQSGSIGLVAAGRLQRSHDQFPLGIGETWN
jgi:hypothetical protein